MVTSHNYGTESRQLFYVWLFFMKKSLITFLILSLTVFQVQAYSLSSSDAKLVNKVIQIIDSRTQKKWISYKQSLLVALKKITSKSNSRKEEIISQIITWVEKITVVTQVDLDNDALNTFHANPSKMREYWLSLYNNYRSSQWINTFTYDKRLEETGQEWSNVTLSRWKITHERTPWDGYYNYPIIEQWFQDRWVTCKVSWRTTSVENTGYHAYYCPKGWDCTDKANEALKWIFDYYLAEKWLPSPQNAHYKTTISPYLQYMGLGISFKNEWNGWTQIYTAAHFCTEFE